MTVDIKKLTKDFGKKVRIERIKFEISQEELAEKANISVATLSKIERGLVLPTVETAARIADALNTTLATIFTFDF